MKKIVLILCMMLASSVAYGQQEPTCSAACQVSYDWCAIQAAIQYPPGSPFYWYHQSLCQQAFMSCQQGCQGNDDDDMEVDPWYEQDYPEPGYPPPCE